VLHKIDAAQVCDATMTIVKSKAWIKKVTERKESLKTKWDF